MKWYHGAPREEWSLWKKTRYVFLRTSSNLWHSPVPAVLLMVTFAGTFSFFLMKSEQGTRKHHQLPQDEAEAWVNQANIKAENIFCTGTEGYVGNGEDAQCVVTITDKKLITLACANVWVQRTGCRIEHLEK